MIVVFKKIKTNKQNMAVEEILEFEDFWGTKDGKVKITRGGELTRDDAEGWEDGFTREEAREIAPQVREKLKKLERGSIRELFDKKHFLVRVEGKDFYVQVERTNEEYTVSLPLLVGFFYGKTRSSLNIEDY